MYDLMQAKLDNMTKKYNLYTDMFFVDLNNVSEYLIRAIKYGTAEESYEIEITHNRNSETIQFYQSVRNDGVKLPFFYVKKETNKQGLCFYSGAYKVKETSNYDSQYKDFLFPKHYAESLYKKCKQMIADKEILSSRIVSK